MEAANVILNDPFYLCIPSKNYIGQECRVILSQKSLVIQASSDVSSVKNREIPIANLVGCLCMKNDSSDQQHSSRSNNQDNPKSVFLSIYFYSLAKSLTKNEYRKRETLLLRCCKYASFEENCNIISRWQSSIFSVIRGDKGNNKETMYQLSPSSTGAAALKMTSPKLLVFVNPNSGTGIAIKTFNSKVRSFFGEAKISFELVVTTHPGHCRQIIEETPADRLCKYAGIVTVSGDGLLFEVYNGLINREDWETVCSIPVGAIPQGSGNGLARSLAHFNGEPYLNDPLVVSVLNVVKLKSKAMDLCLLSTTNQRKMCSFLSVGWGLMADIDIESERLRMIGEARFTVWAVARVMRLRTYKATISYLPVNKSAKNESSSATAAVPLPPLDEPLPKDSGWVTVSGEIVCVYTSMVPFIGTDLYFAPSAKLDDGIIWLMIVKAPVTKVQVTQLLIGIENGSHVNFPWLTFVPVTAFRLVPEPTASKHKSYLSIDGERHDTQAVQAQILPRKGRVFSR